MYSAIARNKRNTWFILTAFILLLAGVGLLAGWLMGNNWWVTAFILLFAARLRDVPVLLRRPRGDRA